jgi:hypothetical protein
MFLLLQMVKSVRMGDCFWFAGVSYSWKKAISQDKKEVV